MALFKSQIATQMSGSVGGTTYAHNKGGMYMRSRSVPTQPNSGNQVEVRNAFTELVNKWINTLTAAQRAAWNLYAENVTVVNKLGDTINNSGQNWYIGCNTPRRQAETKLSASTPRVDDAPTVFDRGDFTLPSFTASEATGLSITFDNTDAWANEDDSALLIFEGAPQNTARRFFKGPWRLVGAIEGNSTTAPTSPETISAATLTSLGYTITAGQNLWLAFSATRADGRLTTQRIIGPEEVAA